MSNGLIALHIVFILVMVSSVWYSGFKQGRKDMVEQLLEDKLFSVSALHSKYKPRD